MKQYTHLIGQVDNKEVVTANNGNTRDIMNTVMLADSKSGAYCQKLAQALTGADQVQTCYNIWKFWKENVKYVEDPDGYQFIKSPAYMYEVGDTEGADCKSFSVGIACCLKHLGIPYAYRFITQEADKPYHHVYVVAYTNKGPVLIDCVIDYFNKENPYARKKDVSPARITTPMPKAAAIGATQAQVSEASWLTVDAAFKAVLRDTYNNCRNAGYADIENAHPIAILKRNKLKKAWTDNFDTFVDGAAELLYLYWDNNQATKPSFVDYQGQQIYFNDKLQQGGALRNTLADDMGIRTGTLQMLCALSIYKKYGVTMEHLLDRCYNMVTYGQPWKPAPGVPYFNFKTGVFVNQGTTPESLQQALQIRFCFPAAGGVGRPYGQPYIATGGWYIQNGATDQVFTDYKKNYVWSDYEKAHVNLLTADSFAPCYATYQKWISGNMVALPAIVVNTGKKNGVVNGMQRVKPAIGGDPITLSIAAIIAIVVAVLNALAAIAGIIFKILDATKHPANQKFITNPPADFKMEYQTVDGCFIGTAPQECGAKLAKYCANGTFTCLTDADLAKPENQAGAPAGGFLGGNSSIWLMVGLAAILLFFGLTDSSKANA